MVGEDSRLKDAMDWIMNSQEPQLICHQSGCGRTWTHAQKYVGRTHTNQDPSHDLSYLIWHGPSRRRFIADKVLEMIGEGSCLKDATAWIT
jgi:hypothetical protein